LKAKRHAAPGRRRLPDEPLVMGAVYAQKGKISTPFVATGSSMLLVRVCNSGRFSFLP
jgi:hypothetical protein